VVPKQLNIDAIDKEIQWHTQHEQKNKTPHLARHHWQRSAEDEGDPDYDCQPGNDRKEDG
jgi:hypothetical protein